VLQGNLNKTVHFLKLLLFIVGNFPREN